MVPMTDDPSTKRGDGQTKRATAARGRSETMDAETLKALKGSIKKWRGIVAGTEIDHGSDNCPLCQLFVERTESCRGCPVQERTGRNYCHRTPYIAFYHATDGRHAAEDSRCAARACVPAFAAAEAGTQEAPDAKEDADREEAEVAMILAASEVVEVGNWMQRIHEGLYDRSFGCPHDKIERARRRMRLPRRFSEFGDIESAAADGFIP